MIVASKGADIKQSAHRATCNFAMSSIGTYTRVLGVAIICICSTTNHFLNTICIIIIVFIKLTTAALDMLRRMDDQLQAAVLPHLQLKDEPVKSSSSNPAALYAWAGLQKFPCNRDNHQTEVAKKGNVPDVLRICSLPCVNASHAAFKHCQLAGFKLRRVMKKCLHV